MLVFILLYGKFIVRLPAQTAGGFILSGGIYLAGAVFFDMLGGREAELHGFDSTAYRILYTAEEFLEMIGVVGFIRAVLLHVEREFG